jgi:hypothetical protein
LSLCPFRDTNNPLNTDGTSGAAPERPERRRQRCPPHVSTGRRQRISQTTMKSLFAPSLEGMIRRPNWRLALILFCFSLGCCGNSAAQTNPGSAPKALVDYINPMIGAGCGDGIYGKTFPGAAMPFGLVQLSPDTITGGDNGCGYSYPHKTIEGFSFTPARLNGRPLDRAWIHYREIVGGGTLEFEMGPEPKKSWASAPAAAHPSLSNSTNSTPAYPAQGEPPR